MTIYTKEIARKDDPEAKVHVTVTTDPMELVLRVEAVDSKSGLSAVWEKVRSPRGRKIRFGERSALMLEQWALDRTADKAPAGWTKATTNVMSVTH